MGKTRKKRRSSRRYNNRSETNWLFGLLALSLGFVLAIVMINHIRQAIVQSQPQIQVQNKIDPKEHFIRQIKPAAVQYGSQYHVLPSITIAQAILESDWGKSKLASNYYNLFGVKDDTPQRSKEMKTKEYHHGEWTTVSANFRVYQNFAQSIAEHDALMVKGTTWNPQQYQHVLAADNYVDAAKALQQDGYATDPDYAQKLIEIIETYNLDQYDPK
ncbi:glycoside hydrolase family 73 protein [Bombilactobacillus folatiphilus]|uniref:Glycoside hydrolase family 73 protein n=1 Tax=Bombilactobacillus folatiphilus TaxID=2923362 RepID=A0ABY4P858_9LACO|nr:glycoside hydrolase family 73 protein [Bombilactobacillus folatiphilus]UQS81833.1 glycoside hydrolase family 73 protein [Bombilactobacillus folatiphilus]